MKPMKRLSKHERRTSSLLKGFLIIGLERTTAEILFPAMPKIPITNCKIGKIYFKKFSW